MVGLLFRFALILPELAMMLIVAGILLLKPSSQIATAPTKHAVALTPQQTALNDVVSAIPGLCIENKTATAASMIICKTARKSNFRTSDLMKAFLSGDQKTLLLVFEEIEIICRDAVKKPPVCPNSENAIGGR